MSSDGNADDEERPRVPVTVLTGFLGAGKTTLLRYVLSQNHGYRIAVVQNEFAEEMGIESPTLVDGASGEPFKELWELPNGCICCSAKDDFIAAIDALLKTPSGAKLDYIIVESVGLADPEAVIRTFWVDDHLDLNVFLDGVVTVVDMTQILSTLGDSETTETVSLARKQLMCADVVLCNKMDLLAKQRTREASEIVAHLKSHNPDAFYVETVRGAVDLKKVLSLHAFDPGRVSTRLLEIPEPEDNEHTCQHDGHGHDHRHSHGKAFHRGGEGDAPISKHPRLNGSDGDAPLVAHGIVSVLVKLPHSVSASKLENFLASVLWEDGSTSPQPHQVDGNSADKSTIVRAKGIFVDSDSGQPSAMQAVGEIFEVVEVSIPAAEVPQAKFLFLGYRLDKAWLHDKLVACAC